MDSLDQLLATEIRIATLRFHMSTLENAERALVARINVPMRSTDQECLTAIMVQHEKIKTELQALYKILADMSLQQQHLFTISVNDAEIFNPFDPELVTVRESARCQAKSDNSMGNIGTNLLSALTPKKIVAACQKLFSRQTRRQSLFSLKTIFKKKK